MNWKSKWQLISKLLDSTQMDQGLCSLAPLYSSGPGSYTKAIVSACSHPKVNDYECIHHKSCRGGGSCSILGAKFAFLPLSWSIFDLFQKFFFPMKAYENYNLAFTAIAQTNAI